MSDTPVTARTSPAPTRLDSIKSFVGDIARPFAIYTASASGAASSLIVAIKGSDYTGGALFIAAVWAGVAALYASKSVELVGIAKNTPPFVEDAK